ncbi:hypothetical protein L211DRAFT_840168 [Terfezia boudieri ATCC MYA-4762]|uniref:C2H2-type domain-containing protein n=1 Tax=Terfezia boudieri ATCC MYA-4762 TaxID=1051890 RepID=A0A3N4LL08_9PEZI|nr:hypothetical protein L211DRAFT_840168 [Terfezia boudieri ATCC MYA-4762]
MRNSSITAYSTVGTECSSIELTAFKGIQSSNNFSFGTAPYNPPSTWAGWGLNVAPNLHPITAPISVQPDRCTFLRHPYDARLAEGELEASTYNVGSSNLHHLNDCRSSSTISMSSSQYASPPSPVSPPAAKPTISTWLHTGKQLYRNYDRKSRTLPAKSFVCEDCSKVFTRNGDLRRHEYTKHHVQNTRHTKMDTGKKPVRNLVRRCPCPRCPTISRLDNLPKHVERRHREVWDAVQERNPHTLWYDKCVEYYRRHDPEHAEFYQWTSIARG